MADNEQIPTCLKDQGDFAGVQIYSGLISRVFGLQLTVWYKYSHDGKNEYVSLPFIANLNEI